MCHSLIAIRCVTTCMCVFVSGHIQSVKKANVANSLSFSMTSDLSRETINTDGWTASVCL